MIDPHDDLAGAQKPYNVIAVIPVHGRLPLLPLTIKRLLNKNGCYKVICVGDGWQEKKICEEAGAIWVPFANKPLGKKWNAGFQASAGFNPDAVLYVGSSDWLCDQWITIMKPYVDSYQMAGVPGTYFMDIQEQIRLVNWKGYVGTRSNESIGIGRMLSKDFLNRIDWSPFDPLKDSSLDRSMKDKGAKVGVNDYMVLDERLKAVSISTSQWENKHQFIHHWMNILPSDKIKHIDNFLAEFPEALELQTALYASTHK